MKNIVKIFAPIALAILIGSLILAFGQTGSGQTSGDGKVFRPPMNGGRGGGGIPPQVLDKLNLTDAQTQQIKTLQDAARAGSKENFDKIKTFDDQLKAMIDGGTFNEEQARQILTGKAVVMTELEIARIKTDIAVKNILTAEQKAQLETLKQQRPDFGRGGQRPEMPPPPKN